LIGDGIPDHDIVALAAFVGAGPRLIKNENPAALAVKLEADEDWRR